MKINSTYNSAVSGDTLGKYDCFGSKKYDISFAVDLNLNFLTFYQNP